MTDYCAQFDSETNKNIETWLNDQYDQTTKEYIVNLIKSNPQEIIDAFYTKLSFGTGGLRGIMGIGSNRINSYTIRSATQGLANYLNQLNPSNKSHAVFIGFDSRKHSMEFAEETAKVLAGNEIEVYLCKSLRPTPLVSFACRYKHCSAGIMITASHNPSQYNGYKVYWNDGGQVTAPHDLGIIEQINAITQLSQVKTAPSLTDPRIHYIEEETDQAYIEALYSLQLSPRLNQRHGSELKIVYTSLHGAGITLLPRVLNRWGFTDVHLVKEQSTPDGDFPTVALPNPEDENALKMGLEILTVEQRDLLIATDPDADRVGIAIRHQDIPCILDGNQIACICVQYVCETLQAENKLLEHAAFIKTIATTELFAAIVHSYNRPCLNVLTGFKYISAQIEKWKLDPKGYQFIFGGEESFGYLLGTESRDKDAIVAAALISEIALKAKLQNKTLLDLLHEIWKIHGIYVEKLFSLDFNESKEGKEQIEQGMLRLRQMPPKQINGVNVLSMEDYESSINLDLKLGITTPLSLPTSNVLLFWLEDGTKLMVRPSGTEPKIKLYCGVVNKEFLSITQGQHEAEKKAHDMLEAMKAKLGH